MKKFQTQYNRHEVKGEVNNEPSMTIPDQSLSIKEILTRYAQGIPLSAGRVPIYEGEQSELPLNWDRMDLSEQQDFIAENNQRIISMRNELSNPKPKKDGTPKEPKQDTQPQKDQAQKSDNGTTQNDV